MAEPSFLERIKKEPHSPIYFLWGAESFLLEQAKDEIIKRVLHEDEMDFNYSSYDLEEKPIELAIDDCETLPFLGERRVVIIKNAIFLTGSKDKSKIEHDLKRFETYIENPNDSTTLIIMAPYEKLDERKKIVKQLKKKAIVFEATKLNDRLLKDWVQSVAKSYDVWMTKEAAERLLSLVGQHLMLLEKEIEKLALVVGEKGEITEEMIESHVARTIEDNIFSLINEVALKRMDQAFVLLEDLLIQKEEPIKILLLLARQFRIMYHAKRMNGAGYGQMQIAKQLKLSPYAVKIAMEQGKYFTEAELKQLMAQCAESDFEMKTGKMEKKLALELFLLSIVHTKKKTTQ